MPNARETSVFLEEPDLNVEGGIALPAEGREQGLLFGVSSQRVIVALVSSNDGVHKRGDGSSSSILPPQH